MVYSPQRTQTGAHILSESALTCRYLIPAHRYNLSQWVPLQPLELSARSARFWRLLAVDDDDDDDNMTIIISVWRLRIPSRYN